MSKSQTYKIDKINILQNNLQDTSYEDIDNNQNSINLSDS